MVLSNTIATLALGVLLMVVIWFAFMIGQLARRGRSASIMARKAREKSERGERAEAAAEDRLDELGFTVIEKHPKTTVGWWVDDTWTETVITGDYLVQRNGELGLIEVKTGRESRPTHRHTRRQLFEYWSAFEVERVYLYNADLDQLYEIEFDAPVSTTQSRFRDAFLMILGSFGGFFVGYFLSR